MDSARSNLIDVTWQQLHTTLSGRFEGTSTSLLTDILTPRLDQLRNVTAPFGKPSDTSKTKVAAGTVVLRDGVSITVEPIAKDCAFAISAKFGIDQIEALVLFRSFLFNEGLPNNIKQDDSFANELVDAITPFYFSERLSLFRVLIPLFRAKENASDPVNQVAATILPELLSDGRAFVQSLLQEYVAKCKQVVMQGRAELDPKAVSRWAKQNSKEQLVLLEVLFWSMWGYVPCDGPLIVQILETAYMTNLGAHQRNKTSLLDDEGEQLQQDSAALWILITVEVLELETIAEPGSIEISENPANKDFYTSSPASLKRIHELVTHHVNSQHACVYLAWTFVLSKLVAAVADMPAIPPSYQPFFSALPDHTPMLMARTCISPEVHLFRLLHSLLTTSPLFVTAAAWKTASTVTDPNAIAFRSVIKGLVICLVEMVPVEFIPDIDADENSLVSVWIALFGRSESLSITGICKQFWVADWHRHHSRRAIFEMARSRFPIQTRSLVRLLRAMTATGFLDTDPLSTADHSQEGGVLTEERDLCDRHVFYFLEKLTTYTQVIPMSQCTGAQAVYEKVVDRHNASNTPAAITYVNLRPVKLPGGSTLAPKSVGKLLSTDGGEYIVVCWEHEHSGWKLLLEVLTDYVHHKRTSNNAKTRGTYDDVTFRRKEDPSTQVMALTLQDIRRGISIVDEDTEDEDIVIITETLDLIRSLIQDNPLQTQQLVEALEAGDSVVAHTMVESQAPDLVQLTTMILEDALSRSASQPKNAGPRTALITSAMSVLSALLALPTHAHRVWLYIRSTTTLFGSDRQLGFASVALAAERVTGHYTMTLALLHLVQQLFKEAFMSYAPGETTARLQSVKEEVMLRAARFVHTEIWVEHLGWKYAQLGDRFEIGRRVASVYVEVLTQSAPSIPKEQRPFGALGQAIVDLLLFRATTSTINPLVSTIASGGSVLSALYTARRFGDARRLIYLLEWYLELVRLVLVTKQQSPVAATKTILIEQAFCARVAGTPSSAWAETSSTARSSNVSKLDPIDVLASYSKGRDMGAVVPVTAMRVLAALCTSLSCSTQSSPPPTIIGHLSNPEATVMSLVRIVLHPYDDLTLRNAVWNFISIAVDREPALAGLFINGQFKSPVDIKGKGRAITQGEKPDAEVPKTAVAVASDMLANWKELWELNPQLLASVMRFLDVVWTHALEHRLALQNIREDADFWKQITSIVKEELGPVPEYRADGYVDIDGVKRSNLHDGIAIHAYRTLVKSYAVHILGLDIVTHIKTSEQRGPVSRCTSFETAERMFKEEDTLVDLLSEAAPSSYDPALYDRVLEIIKNDYPWLSLEGIRLQVPENEREFGDDFAFSTILLKTRIQMTVRQEDDMVFDRSDDIEKSVHSINLNLSLSHSQDALAKSWQFLLQQVVPYLRGDDTTRPILLSVAGFISSNIAAEKRAGDMMATIHGTRLALLLSVLELAWFSTKDKKPEIVSLLELTSNVLGIIYSEAQSPSKSFLGATTVPFHRTILQIIYFCAKQCRNLLSRPKIVSAGQRVEITNMVDGAIHLVTDALRVVFLAARSRVDVELDRDMEMLVAVFEQCTRPDINSSPASWLARCQETDIIRSSLDLFVRIDLVGLSDMALLMTRRQPAYAPHLLLFHMTLASIPFSAERFASEGVLAAYSNNFISSAASSGRIDVSLPELPGDRSPAHRAYCFMLSIVAGVVTALGKQNHYFDNEASGFIQLYGDQISRSLSWTINDPISLASLEEMEHVVSLFYAIAENAPADTNAVVVKVLRVFTTHALMLLQQLSYAVTHPNQLANMFEPITAEERAQLEKETGIVEIIKRPVIARLLHRLFRLSGNILSTLISISRAEDVLLGEQDDWPVHEALVVPHSKVVLGEPASMGTLLELGNCTLDLLRDLAARPADLAVVPTAANARARDTLDVRTSVITARMNLEAVLLYSVTQLAMWLGKPEFAGDTTSAENVDMDESVMMMSDLQQRSEADRRVSSKTTLAERLRRGMSGEMASDLQSLLTKAKPVILKSNDIVGPERVDITGALSHFLQERIIAVA